LLSGTCLLLPGHAAGAPAAIPWLWDRVWQVPDGVSEVALLMDNLELRGERLLRRPRTAGPVLPPSVRVTPVVHVEFNLLEPPPDAARYSKEIAASVLAVARRSTSGWVQLDYEARPSGRAAYRALVQEIRSGLPPGIRLSVTALAWWCQGGAWLDSLGADEVVPMFFRMGPDAARLRRLLREQPQRLHASCRSGAWGRARQEDTLQDVAGRYARHYWFDYKGWKETLPWPMPKP
jgi:hypothetical protein